MKKRKERKEVRNCSLNRVLACTHFVFLCESVIFQMPFTLVYTCIITIIIFYTEIQIRVDRRTTLAQLKEKLVSLIGVPVTGFKVYRVYINNQEYEMERLGDSLMALPSESKVLLNNCMF